MAESLLEKANRLNIKPEGESLVQKAERLGIKPETRSTLSYTKIEPSFQASMGTGFGDVTGNVARTFGNVPSSAGAIAQTAIVTPVENLTKSVELAKDIYKDVGFTEGTKAILAGAFDVYKGIGEAVAQFAEKKDLARKLAPVQSGLVNTRDELVQKIHEARAQGKDTTKLSAGLQYAVDSLEEIDKQIGTKEARTNQALDSAINVAKFPIERPSDVLLMLYGGGELKGGKDTLSRVASPITGGKDTSIRGIVNKIVEPMPAKIVQQTSDDWARIGGDYVRSSKVLAKGEAMGKDAPQFLAERGINPNSTKGIGERNAIADRIATEDTKPFEEVLNKSLKEADLVAPKLPIADIERQAIANVSRKPNLTAAQAERVIADTRAEFEALKRKYGYSMSRAEMNAEKQAYWTAKNWDATRPLQGDINAEIGRAFKNTIENSVDDVNIRGLNQILGDHYDAAKFLRSVDGKAGKLTIGEKAKRAVVRAVSTAVGSGVGGTAGGVTGFVLADSINQAMNAMSNPLREYFLSRLRTVNPEIYSEYIKTLNYLQQREITRASQLKLGSPTPLGSERNPIITPAPTTFESPAGVSKRTTVNPKTGTQYVRNVQTGEMEIVNKPQGNLGGKNSNNKQITSNSNNVMSNNPTTQSALLQEARKYKSAEEFVNREPSYFHATKAENVSLIEKQGFSGKVGDMSKASGGTMQEGVFLYPEKSSAEVFGKNFKSPSVLETKVNGKIYDTNTNTKYGWEDDLQTQEIAKDPKIIAQLKKDGYVGVKSTELGTDAVFVFDKSAVKTKSQLTDIWNKANKK